MNWQTRYRIRHFLRNSFWFVPTLCIAAALLINALTRQFGETVHVPWMQYSLEGAQALLNSIGTSQLTFLVFVVTSMLLLVQISSSQLTPRIIALAFSNRFSHWVLGLFVFTYTLTVATMSRLTDKVPQLTVALAVISTVACIVVLFWFAQRLGSSLRPISVLRTVGEETRKVIDSVYPIRFTTPAQGTRINGQGVPRGDSKLLSYLGPSGVFVAFGAREMVALASKADCLIQLIPQVGDFVSSGDQFARVFPAEGSFSEEALAGVIIVDSERTLEQDPAFGFRIMVDIASRALSPAINDPTTAVLVLDQLHRLLRYVGMRQLSDGVLKDLRGKPRVIYPTPNWEDYVSLAVTEIRQFGATSIQIPRRLRAMLDHLAEVLPEARRPVLHEELALLQRSVVANYPEGVDRHRAETGDRQGMGGVSTSPPKQAA